MIHPLFDFNQSHSLYVRLYDHATFMRGCDALPRTKQLARAELPAKEGRKWRD